MQNLFDVGRRKRGMRKEGIFRYTADGFAEQLDAVSVNALDKHCPFQNGSRQLEGISDGCRRTTVVDAKRQRRQLERRWRSTCRSEDYFAYRKMCHRGVPRAASHDCIPRPL